MNLQLNFSNKHIFKTNETAKTHHLPLKRRFRVRPWKPHPATENMRLNKEKFHWNIFMLSVSDVMLHFASDGETDKESDWKSVGKLQKTMKNTKKPSIFHRINGNRRHGSLRHMTFIEL